MLYLIIYLYRVKLHTTDIDVVKKTVRYSQISKFDEYFFYQIYFIDSM